MGTIKRLRGLLQHKVLERVDAKMTSGCQVQCNVGQLHNDVAQLHETLHTFQTNGNGCRIQECVRGRHPRGSQCALLMACIQLAVLDTGSVMFMKVCPMLAGSACKCLAFYVSLI